MCDSGHCSGCQQPDPIKQIKVAIEQGKNQGK
jgi:hypothetical protein